MELIDLSHVIEHGTITYAGLPGPIIDQHLSFDDSAAHYATGTEFAIGRITMVANTGTYLDTAAHRYRGGDDLAALPLERCAMLPAIVVDVGPGPIGPDQLTGPEISGKAVLLRTGWDVNWGTEQYGNVSHPFLTADGARFLVTAGALLVGIDSVNIDDTSGGERPAHTVLLGAHIAVVEHLTNLRHLPHTGATFTAVPPAIRGMATFSVRAFAAVP